MHEALRHHRQLCLDQAESFCAAAEHLAAPSYPHIVYHLSLLALEEVGKASILSGRMATGGRVNSDWIDRSLTSHQRKLQWAVWSPIDRIDPADFEAARVFAERAHALRLSSLYVDPSAEVTDAPPRKQVTSSDAAQCLDMARVRLAYEAARTEPTSEADEVLTWFLDKMGDPDTSRLILRRSFIERYESMNGDARAWVAWVRDELERENRENRELLQSELAKPGVEKEAAKPKWRANMAVYTPSHSLRPKVLAAWNSQIEAAQLIWSGRKDQLTLQITLLDNEPLPKLAGRATSLAKLVLACLNIGSIGYFWFEPAGFQRAIFTKIRDLENGQELKLAQPESFWGDGRAVALDHEHVEHAIRCMMAFAPLPDAQAEPIFKPYLDGLALISKSDSFYSFDSLARRAFVGSLAGALRHYGGWSGTRETFEPKFHQAFEPFMPDAEHRHQMLKVLHPEGDPAESPLANLRTAKQVADLYLVHLGHQNWRNILANRD